MKSQLATWGKPSRPQATILTRRKLAKSNSSPHQIVQKSKATISKIYPSLCSGALPLVRLSRKKITV